MAKVLLLRSNITHCLAMYEEKESTLIRVRCS